VKPRKRNAVDVHLSMQSSPCVYKDVRNTYQKGDLFCVMLVSGAIYKHPMQHIFRIKEYHL
jgi:hypothetical protein